MESPRLTNLTLDVVAIDSMMEMFFGNAYQQLHRSGGMVLAYAYLKYGA